VVLREEATADALMDPKMLNSKILHIASHGYFNESMPDIVGIVVARPDGASSDGPGFVTMTRLLSKPIRSNMVVISGCETLRGEAFAGEGLNSLSRGVLSQGAGSVIGTLWPIPDRPTARFMEEFYTKLKVHDGDAGRALNQTKKAFMSMGRYKHPYYWSGFILTSTNKYFDSDVFR
jgi:CHAT domain-containing protein